MFKKDVGARFIEKRGFLSTKVYFKSGRSTIEILDVGTVEWDRGIRKRFEEFKNAIKPTKFAKDSPTGRSWWVYKGEIYCENEGLTRKQVEARILEEEKRRKEREKREKEREREWIIEDLREMGEEGFKMVRDGKYDEMVQEAIQEAKSETEEGLYQKAVEILQTCIPACSKNTISVLLADLAWNFKQIGYYDIAVDKAKEAIRKAQNNTQKNYARGKLAKIYEESNELPEALKLYRKIFAEDIKWKSPDGEKITEIITRLEEQMRLSEKATREPIPERVRHEVWRRDQGRCVICGSRENLEFDHIIPVSQGGSNTARNIQILCEKCNRQKKDKI